MHREAGFVEYAEAIKRRVRVPVIAVGRIEFELADRLIAEGRADVVAMARKHLADPELARKLAAGRPEDVRPCIYCYTCVAQAFFDRRVRCAVNPATANEVDVADLDAHAGRDAAPRAGRRRRAGRARGRARRGAARPPRDAVRARGRSSAARCASRRRTYEPNGRLLRWLEAQVREAGVERAPRHAGHARARARARARRRAGRERRAPRARPTLPGAEQRARLRRRRSLARCSRGEDPPVGPSRGDRRRRRSAGVTLARLPQRARARGARARRGSDAGAEHGAPAALARAARAARARRRRSSRTRACRRSARRACTRRCAKAELRASSRSPRDHVVWHAGWRATTSLADSLRAAGPAARRGRSATPAASATSKARSTRPSTRRSGSEAPRCRRPDDAELTPVREAHRFDEAALARLSARPPAGLRRAAARAPVRGRAVEPDLPRRRPASHAYVLRKKPPGKLLPSAHQVEREYRVMSALQGSDVPVPRTHLLCEDPEVIGTPFYVMDCVEGRVLTDARMPSLTRGERAALYADFVRVLAALHSLGSRRDRARRLRPAGQLLRAPDRALEPAVPGLADRRHPGDEGADGLAARAHPRVRRDARRARRLPDRQLHRASVASRASSRCSTGSSRRSAIRSAISPTSVRAITARPCRASRWCGVDLEALGIPDEADVLARYCELTGRARIDDWSFYLVFVMFRSAAIVQGVYKRGLDGNAASAARAGVRRAGAPTRRAGARSSLLDR